MSSEALKAAKDKGAIAPWPIPQSAEVAQIQKSSQAGDSYKTYRETALRTLASAGLPVAGQELWRFTRPQQFPFANYGEALPCEVKLERADGKPVQEGVHLYNGQLALEKAPELFRSVLGARQEQLSRDGTINLHTAISSSVHLIEVEKNAQVGAPLVLFQKVNSALCAPLILIHVKQGAQITILEDLQSADGSFFFPRLEFIADDGSTLSFVSLQRMDAKASYLGRHRFHLGRDVNAKSMHAFIGTHVSRLDLDCRFEGPGSSMELNSVYLADGQRHIDFHPTQEHIAPHCRSELLSKGVVKDRGRAVYYGYIRVVENAQKTDAYQKNRNLLLSSEARADSVPNLEIKANDVRCSHGSSVGQVGPEELFYLMSRGLNRDQAIKLLVEGFFDDVMVKVTDSGIYERISTAVLERLQDGSSSR